MKNGRRRRVGWEKKLISPALINFFVLVGGMSRFQNLAAYNFISDFILLRSRVKKNDRKRLEQLVNVVTIAHNYYLQFSNMK